MKIIALLFVSFVWLGTIDAQNILVSGTILNDENQPLDMANIIALAAADSTMAGYAFTNAQGEFSLKVPAGASYILRVSYLGYQTQEKIIAAKEGQAIANQQFVLAKIAEALQEVTVVEEMPIMISGDTISYKTDVFNKGTEKKLEDVLKNLPGIEVGEDGQIKVEGKTVEKILVEGKEFFDGDTKVATKNIPANAIDKVQVLRNYNDVSPLGRVTNNEDRVAINITLKEGKKSMVFGDVEVGAGPDGRYLAHPNLFYYSPKVSVNFIGDVNNVGQPAFTMQDYFRFSGGFRSLMSKSGSSFSVAQDIGIPLGQANKNTGINSAFGAANFNINPTKKWSVNGFAMIIQNTTERKINSLKTYVGQDSIESKEEVNQQMANDDDAFLAKIDATFTPSVRTHIAYDAFLKYNKNSSANDQFSDFGIMSRTIFSNNTQSPVSLNQNLTAVFDLNEKSIISFEAQHLYKKQDPFYNLQTNNLPPLSFVLPDSSGIYNLQQRKEITTNKLDAVLSYYYVINRTNHVEFTVGGSTSMQKLTSGMAQVLGEDVIDNTDESNVNDVIFNQNDVFAGIHYRSKFGKLTVKPGINVHYYQTQDEQLGAKLTREWVLPLPDFFAKYDFKTSESVVFNYTMQAAFTDVNNAARGTILQSYNSIFRGNQALDNALFHNFSLRYNRYNMFNFTMIYAGATYSKRVNEITNTVDFSGIDFVNTPINSGVANDVWMGFAGYNRRISYYKIGFRGNVAYSVSNNKVNGMSNQNKNLTQSYTADFGTNFKKAPNFDVGYSISISNYLGGNLDNTFINHRPFAKAEIVFLKSFLFEAKYEYNHYTSSANAGPSSIYEFLDAALYYDTPNKKWTLSVKSTNLLNTEFIREDSFSVTNTSTSATYVLPRYVLFGVKYTL